VNASSGIDRKGWKLHLNACDLLEKLLRPIAKLLSCKSSIANQFAVRCTEYGVVDYIGVGCVSKRDRLGVNR